MEDFIGVIVFLLVCSFGISYWLHQGHPAIYQFFYLHGGTILAIIIAIVVIGGILFVLVRVGVFLYEEISIEIWSFKRKHAPPLPVVLPSSEWPFNERYEYATKEVHEILQKLKEYADGYRTVTDEMWSAMRQWGLDVYLTYLRKDGYLVDAYNITYIILQRHVEHLPEHLPLASYLLVPLKDIMEREQRDAPYNVSCDKLYDVLVPYVFEQEHRYQGIWIPARPGSGKTNLLHCMLEDIMPAVSKNEASAVIMDSKSNDPNGLIDTWRSIDYAHEWGIKNVYYFQASDKLAINVFDLGDIDQIVPLFEYMLTDLIGDTLSGPQKAMLTNCLHVIKASDAASIPALSDLLSNGVGNYVQAVRKTRQHIQEYFLKPRTEILGRHARSATMFESAQYRETRQGVLTRLYALLSFSDKLYDTLVSTKTTIDLRKLIDQGSVIIINAKLSDLGSKGSELWQRWWTMLLLEAGRKRTKYHPVHVVFDEAHRGIARDTKIPEILEELRAAKIAVTISHQGDWQIQDQSVLRSLQGLSAITLRATGERGVFNAKVYEKTLTLHVKEADVRYRKRLTERQERKMHAETAEPFTNKDAPRLMPLIEFMNSESEPEIIHPEPEEPRYAEAAEPEPEPFKYSGKPVVTDAEYEILDEAPAPAPSPRKTLPQPKSIHDDYLC